ncbi:MULTISPECIES: monovalent cation/H(+) antiporter subunit G [unclassified Pseudofrankia]|uniref:monovalent cation/H(+) antiporter subunit G n=1 Tax=unclassified Pseudofrankia TaxID=2994372 RepID=UPI0009F33FEF
MLGGAAFCLLGAWGLLRFPDVPARLQAATKPQTIGLLAILAGAALQTDLRYASGLILVGLFQLVTAPVLAQRISRVAYRTGYLRRDLLLADELADGLPDAADTADDDPADTGDEEPPG